MKIGINKFLDLFYSILMNDEIDSINIIDIIEVVKILFSSDDFALLSTRLDINDFTEEQIENHKYTLDIDEDGIVSFNVPNGDIEKLLNNNKVDAGFIQRAINKRAIGRCIEVYTKGMVELKYDNPNGVYNLPTIDVPTYKEETTLFTDGICTNNTYYRGNSDEASTRTVKIDNATYSIMLHSVDGVVNKGEVRGLYNGGDYTMLYNEIRRLISNIKESYDVIVKDAPKVYKFKRH